MGCLIVLMSLGGIVNQYYNTSNTLSGNSVNMNINAQLRILIDNKTVYYNPHDLIMLIFYDYMFCKAFNDSSACAAIGAAFYAGVSFSTNGCPTYSSGGVIATPNHFTATSRCSSLAAVLTNNDNNPVASQVPLFQNYLTTGGFAPIEATSSHQANTNTLTITATWTASVTTNNIEKVGLTLWNDKANLLVINNLGNSGWIELMTADAFTPQNVNSGQSFQVIWTISM